LWDQVEALRVGACGQIKSIQNWCQCAIKSKALKVGSVPVLWQNRSEQAKSLRTVESVLNQPGVHRGVLLMGYVWCLILKTRARMHIPTQLRRKIKAINECNQKNQKINKNPTLAGTRRSSRGATIATSVWTTARA
jgi:hypothetical protein